MSKLFIVDDDLLICNLLETIAEPLFSQIEVFQKSDLFLQQQINDNDIILLDLMMPDMDGIEVIRHLAKKKSAASLVLISGYDRGVLHSAEALAQDHGLKIIKYFTKPIATAELIALLSSTVAENLNKEIEAVSKVKDKHQPCTSNVTFSFDEKDLQQAITNKQLILHYQPQIYMKAARLAGAEVLVRWQHPEHGLIYPDEFIPLAEQSGLIEQLTEEVIRLAVEQSLKWQQLGKVIKLSINISAHDDDNKK